MWRDLTHNVKAFPHLSAPFIQTLGKVDINYHQFHLSQEKSHFLKARDLKKVAQYSYFSQTYKAVVIRSPKENLQWTLGFMGVEGRFERGSL